MEKHILLLALLLSTQLYAQAQLVLVEKENCHTIQTYDATSSLVIVRSNIALSFSTNMDKKVNVVKDDPNGSAHYYELLFPKGTRILTFRALNYQTIDYILRLKNKETKCLSVTEPVPIAGSQQESQQKTAIFVKSEDFVESSPAPALDINPSLQNQNKRFSANGVNFEMLAVPGGSFTMGCTAEQTACHNNEKPAHNVYISSFYIGKYEVTQALWQAVMGVNPSRFKGNKLPVERIDWHDCQEFIAKLNQLTGALFRLPTEAEWEYAARGGTFGRGTQYAGSADPHEVAWFDKNSEGTTHEVGLLRPNELGIHDMSGNVSEWCSDWYASDYYAQSASTDPQGANLGSDCVLRGGNYYFPVASTRIASRKYSTPIFQSYTYGLRLALDQ